MTAGKIPGVISDIEATRCLDYIATKAEEYADAKAERQYLDKFRSSKRAILKAEYRADNERKKKVTDGQCEDYARAHQEYIEILKGWKAAIAIEEKLKWLLLAAQIKLETYRTLSANQRRATQ